MMCRYASKICIWGVAALLKKLLPAVRCATEKLPTNSWNNN